MKRLKHWKKENKRTPQAAPTPAPAPQKTGLSTQKTADICAAASTHIGRRAYQQDCYCIPSDTSGGAFLCVLCDGMGGMESGELASQTAANALTAAFEKAGRKVEKPFEFLKKNILEIDRTVHQLTDAHGNPLRSGTTLLAAIADADKLYWASVGDSRIYLLHGGQLRQLTRDQNYGEVLLQQLLTGKISIEEANADPQKDALTHFVGIGDLNNINMPAAAQPLGADDIVLLCSDGLYRSLEEEEICKILLQQKDNLPFAAWALVQAAIGKNLTYQDNTTVVLLRRDRSAAVPAVPAQKTTRPAPAKPAKTLHLPDRSVPEKSAQTPPGDPAAVQSEKPAGTAEKPQDTKEAPPAPKEAKEEKPAPQPRTKPQGLAVTELIR